MRTSSLSAFRLDLRMGSRDESMGCYFFRSVLGSGSGGAGLGARCQGRTLLGSRASGASISCESGPTCDAPRAERCVSARGAEPMVLVVRKGDTSVDPAGFVSQAGPVKVFTPAQVEEGIESL